MSNKNFFDQFDDYDENIDIVSDSSKIPQKNRDIVANNKKKDFFATQELPTIQVQRKNINPNKNRQANQNYTNVYSNRNSANKNHPQKIKKKPTTPFKKAFFTVFLVALLIFAIAIGVISNIFGGINFDKNIKDNAFVDSSSLIGKRGVKNILLIGSDAREGDTVYRSDTMMLVSIDTNNKKIKLTSFLRDSWVEIPEKGYKRLNSATAIGGIQLLIDTLEYNFKVDIDNYAMVDFAAFEGIVDALDGVNVSITQKESAYLNKFFINEGISVSAGENVHLNGSQALAYCRIRKLDSDFYRTERQRKVMFAIKDKASQASLPTLLKVAKEITPFVQTDLSKSEITKLSVKASTSYLKYDIEQMSIPADGTWKSATKSGQSVLVFDIEENSRLLKNFIYE